MDEEGLAEMLMDDNSIAQVARPGTSLKVPTTGKGAPSQGVRYLLLYIHYRGYIPFIGAIAFINVFHALYCFNL